MTHRITQGKGKRTKERTRHKARISKLKVATANSESRNRRARTLATSPDTDPHTPLCIPHCRQARRARTTRMTGPPSGPASAAHTARRVSRPREMNPHGRCSHASPFYGRTAFCQARGDETPSPQHACADRSGGFGSHPLPLTASMLLRAVVKGGPAIRPGSPRAPTRAGAQTAPRPAPAGRASAARREVAEPSTARKSARSDSSPTLFVYS